MNRPDEAERARRLYAPVPVPPVDNSRIRCNVYVPSGTTSPYWLVRGLPAHGAHVEAEAFDTFVEASAALTDGGGFVLDARVLFEPAQSRLERALGIGVSYLWAGPPTQTNQPRRGRT